MRLPVSDILQLTLNDKLVEKEKVLTKRKERQESGAANDEEEEDDPTAPFILCHATDTT
jgi:hypothetical protein